MSDVSLRQSSDDVLALERRFPVLRGRLPRVCLTKLPTRVHRLARLGHELGVDHLWVKRDDESGTRYGGNKPRKLELLLGEALAERKHTVLTFGGIGTHHGLATAIGARAVGLRCLLVLLKQPVTEHVRRCLLLDYAAGAELHYASTVPLLAARALRLCGRALLRGELPYIIPTGGTSPLGALGYVNAAFELQEQIAAGELPEPEWIFVPLGSGGTLAGLVLGARLAGLRSRVAGVLATDILPPSPEKLMRLATKTLDRLRQYASDLRAVSLRVEDFRIVTGYIGAAYGAPTEAGRRARDLMEQLEGMRLETTYTAKCLAGMIDALRTPEYRGGPVLFWNTYSSIDAAAHLGPLPDYRQLPRPFHQFFTGATVPA
ncbi:MAG TPA: pyridoxal-phosphate dependent enzyme [Candidatus Acidoferrales bacterium]|nr:pyridoxal-phosphate dependent enzyme [Candidatus Acidoferrales bacterium]